MGEGRNVQSGYVREEWELAVEMAVVMSVVGRSSFLQLRLLWEIRAQDKAVSSRFMVSREAHSCARCHFTAHMDVEVVNCDLETFHVRLS